MATSEGGQGFFSAWFFNGALFAAGFVPEVIIGGCLMAVAYGIARISPETLVKAIYPFLIVEIGVFFLCSYVPVRVLWIPRLVGYV